MANIYSTDVLLLYQVIKKHYLLLFGLSDVDAIITVAYWTIFESLYFPSIKEHGCSKLNPIRRQKVLHHCSVIEWLVVFDWLKVLYLNQFTGDTNPGIKLSDLVSRGINYWGQARYSKQQFLYWISCIVIYGAKPNKFVLRMVRFILRAMWFTECPYVKAMMCGALSCWKEQTKTLGWLSVWSCCWRLRWGHHRIYCSSL